jgi:hypothetical protein
MKKHEIILITKWKLGFQGLMGFKQGLVEKSPMTTMRELILLLNGGMFGNPCSFKCMNQHPL